VAFYQTSARALTSFNKGVEKEEAWSSLTEMFRSSCGSLVAGSYTLNPNSEAANGSVYKYRTFHGSDGTITIVKWDPPNSFAYEEELAGSEKRPAKAFMEFKITGPDGTLGLEVFRNQTPSSGGLLWKAVCLAGKMTGKGAAPMLDSLLGPDSRNASAYAGGWKRLPIGEATIYRL